MKKSLSMIAAAATIVFAIPLSFAESSSSVSSASSSSASSARPCAGLTDTNLIICLNAEIRAKAQNQAGGQNRMNSRANAILSSCTTQTGTEKSVCLRRQTKASQRDASKLVIKNRVEKSAALSACKGRGKAHALCAQLLIKKIQHTTGKSSSSSSSSTSSAQ